MRKFARQTGFTLIELLVVIGILAVLLAIVLIAINPARQFAQANNTQRASDVNAILNAVHQYMADNSGTPPTNLTASASGELASTDIDICADLVPVYLAALPADPQVGDPIDEAGCGVAYTTGYNISRSLSNNRITVSAASPELGQVISVTR